MASTIVIVVTVRLKHTLIILCSIGMLGLTDTIKKRGQAKDGL